MTLDYIRELVVSVDENAGHYESAYNESDAFTVWHEIQERTLPGDNTRAETIIMFQIDRYTKEEDDEIAAAIKQALTDDERIGFDYLVDYDRPSGYIHHIFDCEGI